MAFQLLKQFLSYITYNLRTHNYSELFKEEQSARLKLKKTDRPFQLDMTMCIYCN